MKKGFLNIVVAQINPIVGDINYNLSKILNIIKSNPIADIIIFPEMSLTGYPLMDHIHDSLIQKQNENAIIKITQIRTSSTIIIGTFTKSQVIRELKHPFNNSALIIEDGEVKRIINKRLLPDYDIFDERRYFLFDDDFSPIKIKGLKAGILICEDLWDENYDVKVARKLVQNGADILIAINASPYCIGKFESRREIVCKKSKEMSISIIYVNMVGGLDEIVYDGRSFITDKKGNIISLLKAFEEEIHQHELLLDETNYKSINIQYNLNWKEDVLNALKLNVRDYYYKSNIFDGIVLGLSGGIDSAFTAYICTQAVGAENVNAIMMPTRFTSQESMDLSKRFCDNLGINYKIHNIETLFSIYEENIQKNNGPLPFDIADENLQSRIRATILMYYSNKFNWLLVSTGNKSEIGVGYCTLYGDTNGGKNIPGDLLKTQIYDLCSWINKDKEIIPNGIIIRPPTAELRENQKDSDSLPPYEILDLILEEITRNGIGSELDSLLDKGIDSETINRVRKLYLNSEYKRRQLVQTIKVSQSAFGIGRRYPVLKNINFDEII